MNAMVRKRDSAGAGRRAGTVQRRPRGESAADRLSAVPSTLRIPLAARALGDAMFSQVRVDDAHAANVLAALGDDGAAWIRDRASVYGILARTRRLRDLARRFLARHRDGHVVNLGCGLAHYFQWLDNGVARMTDADLPEVVAIRNRLLPARGDRHVVREVDIRSPDWWETLELPASRDDAPVFVFSEGVSMYLQPREVRDVLRRFGERAPAGSVFAFDAMCWLVVGRAQLHPAVRLTGAQFNWGVRDLRELCADGERLALASVDPVMTGYGWPFAWTEPAFQACTGVPVYAVYELHAGDRDDA